MQLYISKLNGKLVSQVRYRDERSFEEPYQVYDIFQSKQEAVQAASDLVGDDEHDLDFDIDDIDEWMDAHDKVQYSEDLEKEMIGFGFSFEEITV